MTPGRISSDPVWAELIALKAEVAALRAEVATSRAELGLVRTDLAELKAETRGIKEKMSGLEKEMKTLMTLSNRVTGGAILAVTLGGIIGGLATVSNVIINAIKLWLKGS